MSRRNQYPHHDGPSRIRQQAVTPALNNLQNFALPPDCRTTELAETNRSAPGWGTTVTTTPATADIEAACTFLALPQAVGPARHFAARHAATWGMEEIRHDLQTITTELVGNAIGIAQETDLIKLRLHTNDTGLTIAVWDPSNQSPTPHHTDLTLELIDALPDDHQFGGWGLPLVNHLSQHTGIDWTPPQGKWVWGLIPRPPHDPATSPILQRQRPKPGRRTRHLLQNGPAIRHFRLLQGWRGSHLATRIGIAPSTLNNIEAERRSASPHMLTRIAHALNIPTQAITRPQTPQP